MADVITSKMKRVKMLSLYRPKSIDPSIRGEKKRIKKKRVKLEFTFFHREVTHFKVFA